MAQREEPGQGSQWLKSKQTKLPTNHCIPSQISLFGEMLASWKKNLPAFFSSNTVIMEPTVPENILISMAGQCDGTPFNHALLCQQRCCHKQQVLGGVESGLPDSTDSIILLPNSILAFTVKVWVKFNLSFYYGKLRLAGDKCFSENHKISQWKSQTKNPFSSSLLTCWTIRCSQESVNLA